MAKKPETDDEETVEEETAEEPEEKTDVDLDFVESHIQNPDILNVRDLILESGQDLPQILQTPGADLETAAGEAVSGEEVTEEDQTPYETVEDDLYNQKQERQREQRRQQIQQGGAATIGLQGSGARDFTEIRVGGGGREFRQNVGMIETPGMGGGDGDNEIYEVHRLEEKEDKPWEQGGDDRVKKYESRR